MTANYKNLEKELKLNKKHINKLDVMLSKEKVDTKNPKYFKLLSYAYTLEQRNQTLHKLISVHKKYARRHIIVTVKSKVKLISTKVGAILWIDAINYVELLGKQIGDTIFMHDMQFKIAGVY